MALSRILIAGNCIKRCRNSYRCYATVASPVVHDGDIRTELHDAPLTQHNHDQDNPSSSSGPNSGSEGSQDDVDLRDMIALLQKKLHIHQMTDWYNVPLILLRETEAKQLSKKYRTSYDLMQDAFPQHVWDKQLFYTRGIRQKFMERVVQTIFPGYSIERNTKKQGLVTEFGHPMEIDCFLPQLNLGFEYQEQHHYFANTYAQTLSLEEIQARDAEKVVQAKALGITILQIPFWWDFQVESLIATIKKHRPDITISGHLGVDTASPIPTEIPPVVAKAFQSYIPDYGVTMAASPLPKSFDATGWWVFEKYDGIRAVWHPGKRSFMSKHGKAFALPDHIVNKMPSADDLNFCLDGEFWFGHNSLGEAMKISSHVAFDKINWSKFKYMIFDCIIAEVPFSDRYNSLLAAIPKNHDYLRLSEYTACTSKQHLYNLFSGMVAKSAEGIVVRDPRGLYVPGLSKQVLKFRAAKHQKALLQKKLGQHAWLCWVPVVQQENDYKQATMLVDQKSGDLAESLREGDVVEYRYYYHTSLNSGFTINPVIYCKRSDLTWEQVCNQKQLVIAKARRIFWKPRNTSSWGTPAERRQFFVDLAEDLGFNPLIASNWYSIPRSPIIQKQGGSSVLQYHNNSYVKAIVDLFPELRLDPDLFANYSRDKDIWTDPKDRRAFMDKLAQHMGFDPLVPSNWEDVSTNEVITRGGRLVLKHHNGSLLTAVKELYPELSFRPDLGVAGYWEDAQNQRRFFDSLAAELKFDPLIAENWLRVKSSDVVRKTGGNKILSAYGNSHIHALAAIYPKLDLSILVENDWTKVEARRLFFDTFAASRGFDPLNVSNWYQQSKKEVSSTKGGSAVIQYHGQSLIKALVDLYPELQFNLNKFSNVQQNYWDDAATHKTFFDEIAKEGLDGKSFDPLIAENWYSLTHSQVIKRKGGTSIVKLYSNSFIDALIHVYPQVTFKRERFNKANYWTSPENCRAFFDEFAKENNFDPLLPQNWYSVRSTDVRAKKCAVSVLRHYKFSHALALVELYPEVKFDLQKFSLKRKSAK